MVPQYKKIGTALITAILLGLFLAGSGLMTSWAKNEVIEVPGGDVEALYAAVYDEDGLPRDNVEIVLEPGVFFLEQEDKPFGGRLVLGDNTILRSTLDLPLNDDFVPTGEDPCPTGEEPACGAIIDGSQLPDPDNAFDESYIVTGNGSKVSRLTLQSDLAPGDFGDRIGIQLLPHGSDPTFAVVDRVIVRGTLLGIQIASTTGSNNLGLVRHSWLTENHFGTNVVQIAPDSSGVDDARLEVVASFNLMHDNTEENFLIIPGMGGDRNDMVVSLIDNEFGYGGFASVVVQVLENFIYDNDPASDNKLSFSISGGQMSGRITEAGDLEGVGLLIRNLSRSGSEEASSNNVINGQIKGVEFENTASDVVFVHDEGPGQDNQTVLVMRGNRHVDDLGGMGQFSVTDNPPETEFLMAGSQTSFEEQEVNFNSAGLEGHFTGNAGEPAAGQAAPAEPPDSILFVGNSLTWLNEGIDYHLEQLAASADPPLVTETDMTGGGHKSSLELVWTWTDAVEMIGTGDFDLVVVQEDLPLTDVATFYEFARKFDTEIKNSGAETVLLMHWYYEVPENATEPRLYHPITIEEIAQAHRDIATELGAEVAPVGLAWQRVMEERPEMDLYNANGFHPSIYGTYLAANVVYATVLGKDPGGLAYLPPEGIYTLSNGETVSGITEEEAAFLQRIAWETVQEYQAQQ